MTCDIASLLSSIYPFDLDAKPLRVMSRSERLQRDGEALLARAELARREAAELTSRKFDRSSTVERVDVAHEAAGSIPVGQPMLGGHRLEHPKDAIYFEPLWPYEPCNPDPTLVYGQTVLVCTAIDVERGVVTYSKATVCDQTWPLQPCEVGE